MMWWEALLLVVLTLGVAIAGALIYGTVLWQTEAKDLRNWLAAAQLPARTSIQSNQGFFSC